MVRHASADSSFGWFQQLFLNPTPGTVIQDLGIWVYPATNPDPPNEHLFTFRFEWQDPWLPPSLWKYAEINLVDAWRDHREEWFRLSIPCPLGITNDQTHVLKFEAKQAPGPPWPTWPGDWYVMWFADDLILDDGSLPIPTPEDRVAYRKWTVMQTLREKLIGIAGGEFHHDIKQRVFYSLVIPEDDAADLGPEYICIPFDGQVQRYPEVEDRHSKIEWTQGIWAFIQDPSEDLVDREGRLIQLAADMEDDIIKALTGDPKFDSGVHNSEMVESRVFAGVDKAIPYAEVYAQLRFEAWIERDDLGPA